MSTLNTTDSILYLGKAVEDQCSGKIIVPTRNGEDRCLRWRPVDRDSLDALRSWCEYDPGLIGKLLFRVRSFLVRLTSRERGVTRTCFPAPDGGFNARDRTPNLLMDEILSELVSLLRYGVRDFQGALWKSSNRPGIDAVRGLCPKEEQMIPERDQALLEELGAYEAMLVRLERTIGEEGYQVPADLPESYPAMGYLPSYYGKILDRDSDPLSIPVLNRTVVLPTAKLVGQALRDLIRDGQLTIETLTRLEQGYLNLVAIWPGPLVWNIVLPRIATRNLSMLGMPEDLEALFDHHGILPSPAASVKDALYTMGVSHSVRGVSSRMLLPRNPRQFSTIRKRKMFLLGRVRLERILVEIRTCKVMIREDELAAERVRLSLLEKRGAHHRTVLSDSEVATGVERDAGGSVIAGLRARIARLERQLENLRRSATANRQRASRILCERDGLIRLVDGLKQRLTEAEGEAIHLALLANGQIPRNGGRRVQRFPL